MSLVAACCSIVIGLFSISLQIASYAVTKQRVDYVSAGLWGGLSMISSASVVLVTKYRNHADSKKRFAPFSNKKTSDTERLLIVRFKWIVALTSLAGLSGLLIVILYSWNLDRFFRIYTTVTVCQFYAPGLLIDPNDCVNLVVIDFLFIAIGLIAMALNSILLYTTLRSTPKTYFYKEPRVLINPPPRLDRSQILV